MYDVKRSARGATRNNLIFNDVRIFRVGDPATLKMLNLFIVSLLRGVPYYLLFNIGKLFSGLDTTGKPFSGLFLLSRAGGILG